MRDLLLTLGHNASAVAVEDGYVLNAYEAERITGVKSDSRFPEDAIGALIERSGCRPGGKAFDRIYVCHWDPAGRLDGMKSKYWNRGAFSGDTLILAQEHFGMTHHDGHAHAAIAFAGKDFPWQDTGLLVIDGFGNMAEHISFYRMGPGGHPQLQKRMFGYETSLGLMYQYATAFLGMKMHEDEYKLLGYGAKIAALGLNQSDLDEIALKESDRLVKKMRNGPDPKFGIDLDTLPQVQQMWGDRFISMLNDAGLVGVDTSSEEARICLGYLVQCVLEFTVDRLIRMTFGVTQNLIVTGGVAYNVALNRLLTRIVPGKLCFMPLAGDQGNAFGIWAFHNRMLELNFGDLCWGVRSYAGEDQLPEGLLMFDEDSYEVECLIKESLANEGFVNIVRGRMEFGPRALCNTTTLARADNPNVAAEINRINGRNSVMPFAPVVWHEHLTKVFPDADRLWKSQDYMITALDYNVDLGRMFPGAALTTARGKITGRPQSYAPKYEGDSVAKVLSEYGLLINTSFNVHGVPIPCDLKQVIHSHQYQRERNPNVRTIVIKEKQA